MRREQRGNEINDANDISDATDRLRRLGLAYVPLCHGTWAPTGKSNGP